MQQPIWPQIPLVKMSWKTNVPLDESLVGKALSISSCPAPGCLGWGNVQRHQNAFHRTEEACPVAAHMRKLSQNQNAHRAVLPTSPNPIPHRAQNPVPHPPSGSAPLQTLQSTPMVPKENFYVLPPAPQPVYAHMPFQQLPITEQIKLSYLTWVTTNGNVSTSIIDFAPTQ
ncbi:unnamed protein product [Caenorhabditis brenneri]